MKNLIFSIWRPAKIEKNFEDRRTYVNNQLEKYFDKLVDNKKLYADKIGAEFKLLEPESDLYDNMNFEKLFLLDKFAYDYDNVLYLDLDVIANTTKSFFDKFDMNTLICRYEPCTRYDRMGLHALLDTMVNDSEERRKYIQHLKQKGEFVKFAREYIDKHFEEAWSKLDKYHWMKKGQEVQKIIPDGEHWIFNTGITGGGSDIIKKLNIHKHYEEFKKLDVQQNNEVFLTWLVKKEKFPLTQLPEWWHYNCLKSDNKIANACMWHVTDKNFERVFRLVNF
jgi:hypothetical protein